MKTEVYQLIHTSVTQPAGKPNHIDETLSTIIDEFDNGNFSLVEGICESLLKTGCHDIRVICYYIYSSQVCFSKVGTVELFPLLSLLFSNCLDRLLPQEAQLIKMEFSLIWLFRKIERKLLFYAQKNNDEFMVWRQQFDCESLAQIDQQAIMFIELCDQLFVRDKHTELKGLIQGFRRELSEIVVEEKEPVFESGSQQNAVIDEVDNEEINDETSQTQTDKYENTPDEIYSSEQGANDIDLVDSDNSYPLTVLLNKMNCFMRLTEQQEYIKASIISADIFQVIDDFDPKQFFPSIFKVFFTQHIAHSEELQQAQAMCSQYSALPLLEAMYHMDLDTFMIQELSIVEETGCAADNVTGY